MAFRLLLALGLAAIAATWIVILALMMGNDRAYLEAAGGAVRTSYTDFAAFWTAAQFALDGRPLDALDSELVREFQSMEEIFPGAALPWLYPPLLLLLMTPLGLLGFIEAWAVFVAVSVIALGLALRRYQPGAEAISLLVVFSPASFLCAARGQVTMLIAAALMAGLAAFVRRRDVEAGLILALASLKPQVCLGFPTTAAASRNWRLVGAGVAGVLLYAALPIPVYGLDYWRVWLDVMLSHPQNIRAVPGREIGLITWEIIATMLGAGPGPALAFQGVMSALGLALMAATWWPRQAARELKAASLLLGIVAVTPYAFGYAAVYPLLGAMVLMRSGRGPAWARIGLFAGLWTAPLAWPLGWGIPLSVLVAPLVLAGLVGCAVLARREGRAAPAGSAEGPGEVVAGPVGRGG